MHGYVPLLILIGNIRSEIFMMDDRSKDLVDGGLSRIRWGVRFWDVRSQHGFGMWRI